MASRDLKEHVYIEALEDAITNVEMIENHLERLSDENKVVAMHILRKDRIKTILSLELALSTYCILLRKMQENHFISYSDAIRMDINSIIHSNRFEYYDGEIIVFSAGMNSSNKICTRGIPFLLGLFLFLRLYCF